MCTHTYINERSAAPPGRVLTNPQGDSFLFVFLSLHFSIRTENRTVNEIRNLPLD